MGKQIVVILFAILFNVKMNTARSADDALTKDTGIAQSVAPALILDREQNILYYIGYIFTGTWYQAMLHCNSLNMDLVSIETKQENDFLFNQMKALLGDLSEYQFWSSGTTLPYDKWVWMTSGRPIFYTNWEAGEPNNGPNEHCLEIKYIYKRGLTWNDVKQDVKSHALCEAKITKSVAEMFPQFCNCSSTNSVSVLG
ncbi:macrophage mannose receptor 1-like [Diabrotica virgifera virgifera]|uniref:C-type lectin domain-containing protein n=1 Tax=Diabrotica virgifera virgifera TaxID=50390 RepID=A0ABM5L6Q0_DIAVI|nr:macrophage mannose receptor 1-like [Diabrotica virgifera virgifera]